MSKDTYGAVNAHYGSEPDTERDEAYITQLARERIAHHGFCPVCRGVVMRESPDEESERWADAHAEACHALRERVVAQREADRD